MEIKMLILGPASQLLHWKRDDFRSMFPETVRGGWRDDEPESPPLGTSQRDQFVLSRRKPIPFSNIANQRD